MLPADDPTLCWKDSTCLMHLNNFWIVMLCELKINTNSIVIHLWFFIHISAAQLSDLSCCKYLALFIVLWSNYFSVKSKQWKSTTQRSLYSTILSHIWCTLHALWDYYLDPYNTINAVEKQKPLAPSRNWISLMSSLAHWW